MATNSLATKSWIEKTPGICGGDACIRGTRIAVWMLVNSRRLGIPDQELWQRYEPPLNRADLDAAWDYYKDHSDEIDQAIELNEES